MATEFYCYLLETDDNPKSRRTYIGFTVNPTRRLRQHNREIKGGAKHTRGRHWDMVAIVSLSCKKTALSFEWFWKHRQRKNGRWTSSGPGAKKRIERLWELMKSFEDERDEIVSVVKLDERFESPCPIIAVCDESPSTELPTPDVDAQVITLPKSSESTLPPEPDDPTN